MKTEVGVRRSPGRWWTLGVVAIGTFMLMLDMSAVSVALPAIHASVGGTFADLQWVFDAYALSLAALLVAAGSTADRLGVKKICLAGLAVGGVSRQHRCSAAGCARNQLSAEPPWSGRLGRRHAAVTPDVGHAGGRCRRGALVNRVPFRVLMGLSVGLLAVGMLLLQTGSVNSRWTVLVPRLFVTGLALGIFNSSRAALAVGLSDPARAGIASGISETFQTIGMAVGLAGVGALFEHRVTVEFLHSPIGQLLGPSAAEHAANGISSGAVDTAAMRTGPLYEAVLAAAQSAFVLAFHDGDVAVRRSGRRRGSDRLRADPAQGPVLQRHRIFRE